MNEINANNIREYLFSISNKDYKDFSEKTVPHERIIGIRIPVLRDIAKNIAKGDWRNFIDNVDHDYYEERMIHGMVIGYSKAEADEVIYYLKKFIPFINSWAVCDCVVSGLKIVKKHQKLFWDFMLPYLESNEEFKIRFVVVMMLSYYINDDYIHQVISFLDKIDHKGYYVKMGVAWAISYCYIFYPELTLSYLKSNNLDDFTYNKSLQKIVESYRVDELAKGLIRKMKRKKRND